MLCKRNSYIKMVVVIFEHSQLIAERLIELISQTNEGITFHHTGSYEAGVELLKKHQPGVVLLELKFAGNNIIDFLVQIKALNEKAVVIVMFNVHDEQKLEQCKRYGADYILDRYFEFEKIPDIISSIITRNKY